MSGIGILVGMVLSHAEQRGDDELVFTSVEGRVFHFYHSQSCCESVEIESIVGDLQDLVGEPLLMAEEVTHVDENPDGVGCGADHDAAQLEQADANQ